MKYKYIQNQHKPTRKRKTKISKELQKYSIDNVALNEVKLAESGCIKEETGFNFYSSGKISTGRSELGVFLRSGMAFCKNISMDPKPVSDRLVMLRFSLVDRRYCTPIATNAQTMTKSPEEITSFYDQHDQILYAIPTVDKIIFLGDFNPRVGQSHYTWPKVLGRFRIGKLIISGNLLLYIFSHYYISSVIIYIYILCASHHQHLFIRTECTKDLNTGPSLTTSSFDSVICQTFWTQEW